MSQRMKDGIVLDNTIYVIDENNKGIPLYVRLIQLFMIIAGGGSAISIFNNCFSLKVSQADILINILLISIALFLLVLYQEHDLIKIISISVIYLFVLLRWSDILKNGFYLLENAVLDRASSYYGSIGIRFIAEYSEAERDLTFLIIMAVVPIMAVTAVAIVRHKLISLCYIVLLLPVAASFAFGITPPESFLILYIIVMLFLARSSGLWKHTKFKDQKAIIQSVNLKSAIVISIMALTLFLILKLFIPSYKYDRVTKIKDTKYRIQTFIYNFSLDDITRKLEDSKWKLFKSSYKAYGGLSEGKLGRVDEVKYDNVEHLRVTLPESSISNEIYLKGYVGSVYTGDSWEGPTLEMRDIYKELQKKLAKKDFEPVNQNNIFLHRIALLNNDMADFVPGSITGQCKYNFIKGNIKIDYEQADKKHIYAPYFTDFEGSNAAKYKWDLYAEPITGKSNYEFEYYYNFFRGMGLSDYLDEKKLGSYAECEKLYRRYVYQVYTKLPNKGLERLKSEFSRKNAGINALNVQSAVSYVKDYLDNNTQYTLSPGKLPKGKDFAEYFLYENRKGYCTHYATAGVLMLRAMGIPARYVEGYALGSSDILSGNNDERQVNTSYSDQYNYKYFENTVTAVAKDSNAHAWAEVYIDGCGWYPIEFTPGYSMDANSAANDAEAISKGITGEPETTPKPTNPAEPTQAPDTEENNSQPTKVPSAKKDNSDNKTSGSNGQQGIPKKSAGTGWIVLFLIPVTALGSCYIFLTLRKKKFNQIHNPNKKALMVYMEIEKLLKSYKALPKRDKCLEDHMEYAIEHCQYIKADAMDSCMETVRRARFGRYVISTSELKAVERFYDYLRCKIYRNASFLKRIYLKLILI